jgi:hypothetical protein
MRTGIIGRVEMPGYVEVTLTISVSVDDEYSSDEHVEDIINNTRRLFPAAEVTVNRTETTNTEEVVLISPGQQA